MDLEVQVMNLQEKLKRNKELLKKKSYEIKKLDALVRYYQKRTFSLKELIKDLKSQELINEKTENALNVRNSR